MKVYDPQATCNRIFKMAAQKGWSDSKLANILNLTPPAISKWRRGTGSPSLDTLVIIADLFQVSLDDLMGRIEVDMDFHVPDER